MKNLINEIAELVYVVDPETYNLEFINDTGKKIFGIAKTEGCKCYEAIHGRSEPCGFCNNHQLSEADYVTWECSNQKVGRHYLLKDSLIDWDGRKLKVEIACDITEQKLQQESLQEILGGQNMIVDCVKMLHSADDHLQILDAVIERVGSFLKADRAYIYKFCPDRGIEDTHVWYNANVPDQMEGVLADECNLTWRRKVFFNDRDIVFIPNIVSLQSRYPEEHSIMAAKGIRRLITAPLELENSCVGYIEIDNPPVGREDKIIPLIRTLAYFISSCMCICKKQSNLELLIYTDSLTKAKNRHAYNQMVEKLEDSRSGEVGVLYIDINDMKGLNDRFGHAFGDHVLVDLAQRIAAHFDKDEIFRIDGNEFVVISQNQTKSEFLKRIDSFCLDMDNQMNYNVSVGYQWSENQENIKDLIAASDRMMYESKKGFYFDRPMPRHCRYQYDEMKELLEPDVLSKKLAEGEFLIYFQPKMAVSDKRLIGAEALIRYQSRDGYIVSPDRFIPLLEEKHLIDMVDLYVYESVCHQIVLWQEMGFEPVPISVNFSRYSLMEVGFLERLERIAKSYSIDKRLLEIEVTESAETEQGFDFLGIIGKIRKAGFTVSIDDFGIKYANLFLFTTLDFDVLKIDKSLTKDLVRNEKAREVLRSISDICKRMGISMIVEGIETEEQLNVLENMECYGVQGYYFSRPIPKQEYESRYMAGSGWGVSA